MFHGPSALLTIEAVVLVADDPGYIPSCTHDPGAVALIATDPWLCRLSALLSLETYPSFLLT